MHEVLSKATKMSCVIMGDFNHHIDRSKWEGKDNADELLLECMDARMHFYPYPSDHSPSHTACDRAYKRGHHTGSGYLKRGAHAWGSQSGERIRHKHSIYERMIISYYSSHAGRLLRYTCT